MTFPQRRDSNSLQQDEEDAEVHVGEKKRQIRIQDYDAMYAQPGLYECIIHERLACDSPRKLAEFLKQYLTSSAVPEKLVTPLSIPDIAAGNGIVGAELRKQLTDRPGIRSLIGTDILESARSAALRDRPDVYDDYVVADLTQSPEGQIPSWSDVVVICAALGPGHLPLEGVEGAIALLREGGLLALAVSPGIKSADSTPRWQSFMANVHESGGGRWGQLKVVVKQRYKHRMNVQGEWIEYMALIYEKMTSELVDKDA